MQQGRRFFTYESAMGLLPEIIEHLRLASDARASRKKSEADLAAYKQRLVMAGGAFPNTNRLAAYADQAKTFHEAMKGAVDYIQNEGIEVRDVENGLIAFPAMYQGQTVYLCYQLGDDSITHWHHSNESFSDRRLVTPEFISQLEIL